VNRKFFVYIHVKDHFHSFSAFIYSFIH